MKMLHEMKQTVFTLALVFFFATKAIAQWGPSYTPVRVIVSADNPEWKFKLGEDATFSIAVFENGNPMDGKVSYSIMPDMMEPTKQGELTLKNGIAKVSASMKQAGFLRCKATINVNGKSYTGIATAAFDPEKIEPVTTMPTDFKTFWESTIEANKQIPLNPKFEKMDDLSDESVNVYHVKFQNFRYNSYIYGILSIPKKEGKFPALLKVPGAGVWPHFNFQDPDAKKGLIVLEIRIHGIPMIMSEYGNVYGDLWSGGLNEYWTYNLDHKDKYYYKRVYAGCAKAVDFIHSLPEFDGENLGVSGGSQGGALSIITAALDSRVDYLVCYYPALSDMTGYLNGRAGGWPHIFDKNNIEFNGTKEKIETSKYYDVVNFAKMLKVPGYYSWGYNDEVCPPTSVQSAFNVITAPKEHKIMLDAGHYSYPEQTQLTDQWMYDKLTGKN